MFINCDIQMGRVLFKGNLCDHGSEGTRDDGLSRRRGGGIYSCPRWGFRWRLYSRRTGLTAAGIMRLRRRAAPGLADNSRALFVCSALNAR